MFWTRVRVPPSPQNLAKARRKTGFSHSGHFEFAYRAHGFSAWWLFGYDGITLQISFFTLILMVVIINTATMFNYTKR